MGNNSDKQTRKKNPGGIGPLVRKGFWVWGRTGWQGMCFLLKAGLRLLGANIRRRRYQQELGTTIPTVLVLSVTMSCNYNCQGCYSRGRSETDELTSAELDSLLTEAEAAGLLAVVVTGGEPLMRADLLEIIKAHQKLLFILITNGSLMTSESARHIKKSGNIVVLVSIEGSSADTDIRRGSGAHDSALQAMAHLKNAGAFFGFAATNTAVNSGYLGSDSFINEMIQAGCTAGLLTEYVPCDSSPKQEWIMDTATRSVFRQRVLALRSSMPITLVQFPQDEYGDANLCTGAGRASLHINAQGGVEPCPFVPISLDNIRQGGLKAAILSSFLKAIREQSHLMARQQMACSLFEHLEEVEYLADSFKE